ncbi:conserved hypothetical protein [Leishmania infantum JPCM5]|uniref:Uncharacterized protein n=4 Tax=Leishmania donovani species complex TaxID=38574 RepID=A4IDV9_LEIIN|nr:conserved hypothetical protein [Leishmania infantum JPCM5]XP_003865682.1 hypothetical protein, conserved [Leishmania donovani]CAC9552514.1 hypothetical_protein_-_conserved [Leishmania infantum]AYU83927.1 hypothetical protein LdCL_360064300 [Leishmania donovani]CAM73044.1 conserved hypothetical protein [Leishmania infantum JPCM5]CBZ39005.1 hypothetical protein, conserved [Leishmania donovani]SUZ46950.1 hypothetical_protein_-_conserved [Leishmania infantum]|eukprot:XP_001469928.1 conserved hypothetical protein [Leishmania infantum JPCM5]
MLVSSPLPSAAARAAVALLFLMLGLAHRANGWSGADAYTIVLLNGFDTDMALQDQFYNAPNGTLLTIARSGYRLMDRDLAPPTSAPTLARETVFMPAGALDERLSTAMGYQGTKAVGGPLPFRCRLSGEWVVWSKERPRRSCVGEQARGKGAEEEPVLLHCRLPLPQNRMEQALRQRRYIARNRAAMSAALEAWWHTAASEQSSRCLYGDGEKALTGRERYYELCPAGVVYRVQHQRLKRLLQPLSPHRGTEGASTKAEDTPNVLDFLHTMHHSLSSRQAILQNPRYSGVFEQIGRYHSRISKPRWNPEYLVWESWYPSANPCATHYTILSDFAGAGIANKSVTARARGAPHAVRPQDAYWKTVVRFRCPSHRPANETHKRSLWTVTEARQLCEYHVEVMSELICGWEQELDSFQVNPVPCVVVD